MEKELLFDTIANVIDSGIEQDKSADKIASAILQIFKRNIDANVIEWMNKMKPDFDKQENYQHGFHDAIQLMQDHLISKMDLTAKAGGV